MNLFELNKIAGAIFFALLILVGSIELSKIIYSGHETEKPGYVIEVPTTSAGKKPAGPEFESSIPLLASADPAKGARLFKLCMSCHDGSKNGVNKIGPHLWGVVSRAIAHVSDFSYSKTLLELGEEGKVWTFDNLDHFIRKPRDWAKGTKMGFAGLRKATDRANLLAYLRTLSDNPVDLPKIKAPEDNPDESEESTPQAESTGEKVDGASSQESSTEPVSHEADDASGQENSTE